MRTLNERCVRGGIARLLFSSNESERKAGSQPMIIREILGTLQVMERIEDFQEFQRISIKI